jgi:hypothetical protein
MPILPPTVIKISDLVPSPLRDDRQGWRKCGSGYGICTAKVRMRGIKPQNFNLLTPALSSRRGSFLS